MLVLLIAKCMSLSFAALGSVAGLCAISHQAFDQTQTCCVSLLATGAACLCMVIQETHFVRTLKVRTILM